MTRKKAAPARTNSRPKRRRSFSAVALWPLVAVILFGALLGVVLLTRGNSEQPAAEQATIEPVWSTSIDSVKSVTASFADNGEVTVVPDGDAYQLTAPSRLPVDQDFGKALFTILSTLKPVKLVDENAADRLSEFGLDNPYGTVTVNLDDGTSHTLLVGDASPVSQGDTPNRYVLEKGSDKVYLVSGIDVEIMNRTVDDWRDHDPLKIDVDSTHQVEVDQGQDAANAYTIEYRNETSDGYKWVIRDGDVTAPASTSTVRTFISAYDQLKAEEFVDENPSDLSKYGLDTPSMKITFAQEGVDVPEVITFGLFADNKGQMVYAKNARWPSVFTVNTSIFSSANPVMYSLMELKPMMPVSSPKLDEIDWTPTSGEAVRLTKTEADKSLSEANWTRTVGSGEATELDSDATLQIIQKVLALEASNTEVVKTDSQTNGEDTYGLNAPAGVLHVHWAADDTQPGGDINLTVSATTGSDTTRRYFTVNDYNIVYAISDTNISDAISAITGSE